MTDIIGILGEQDDATVGTHTVYTVPAGKAARVQVMYRGQIGGSAGDLTLRINGVDVFKQSNITASNYVWSTSDTLYNTNASVPDGSGTGQVVAKYGQDYYMSAGDTLQYIIGSNDFSSIDMFAVGVELDAT
jgi:hypothetical protein